MYTARISRQTPTAFIVLIDQSGSMSEKTIFDHKTTTKAQAVSCIVDMMINEFLLRCMRDGHYRDYFDIAVLGYGNGEIRPLIKVDSSNTFISPSQFEGINIDTVNICRERILPSGKSIVSNMEQKVWVRPTADGDTPMYAALRRAYELLGSWIARHKELPHFPPVVFNITDGEASDATDSELKNIAQRIKSLSTADGNVLLINIHVATQTDELTVIFPQHPDELPAQRYARLLFDMASTLPSIYDDYIREICEQKEGHDFRGMSYNTDMNQLIGVMSVGSASINFI